MKLKISKIFIKRCNSISWIQLFTVLETNHYMCYGIQHYLKPGKLNLGLCYPILALSKEPVLDNKLSISIGTLGPNFSLDGLMPRRSHLRRGDHIYPRAITSCPGHALCLTWQIKCTCSGDHIRAWCQELQRFAWYCNSWHQA